MRRAKFRMYQQDLRVVFPNEMTTEEALQASIDKWTFLVSKYENGENPVVDSISTCGLCHLYINNMDCSGCPVAKSTGEAFCEGTPFVIWSTMVYRGIRSATKLAKAAKKELEFLKSLQTSAAEPTEESGGES